METIYLPRDSGLIRSKEVRGFLLLVAVVVLSGAAAATAVTEWRTYNTPRYLRLPDGTEAYFLSNSKVIPVKSYSQHRELVVDGDVLLRVARGCRPLIIRSRLLRLTVTGKTDLRMTAYSNESGEQVEVLDGHVRADKNYPSTYREPDQLTGGQMTMVNRDIDLMEKENTDLRALKTWSDAMAQSVQPQLLAAGQTAPSGQTSASGQIAAAAQTAAWRRSTAQTCAAGA